MGTLTAPLSSFLAPERIAFLDGKLGKRVVLERLARLAVADLPTERIEGFLRSVLEREDVACTGIGLGAAVPHARIAGIDRCRLAVGICRPPVDYEMRDGLPVTLVALLAARESDHTEHLHLLAALAGRLRDGTLVERLSRAELAGEVLAGFGAPTP